MAPLRNLESSSFVQSTQHSQWHRRNEEVVWGLSGMICIVPSMSVSVTQRRREPREFVSRDFRLSPRLSPFSGAMVIHYIEVIFRVI